ncbi:MAG: hypothetical protein RRY55_08920 [Bacteroidales bacterium]
MQKAEGEKGTLKKQLIQSQKELLEASNLKIRKTINEKDLLELSLKKSDIYQLFHEAVNREEITLSEEHWKELQQIIDITYNNFTKQLYALCPQISEHELRICYLIKISISIKGISQTLIRSTSAISNSRVRLYKKIHGEGGTADMFDKFILDL